MNKTNYKIIKALSHPTSAFLLVGTLAFFIAIAFMHESDKSAWKMEKQRLVTTIKAYESYKLGVDVKDSDFTYKTGNYIFSRIRTLAFNTKDARSECIHRLSETELKFNDMLVIRICQNKLPFTGEFERKGTLTSIVPILSPTDELLGIRIRSNSEAPPPSLLDTFDSWSTIIGMLVIVLISAISGSLLSVLAKKYLIELPTIARYDDLTGYLRRDTFFVAANKALDIANLTKHPVCVLLIDIDHFKNVNDTFGHSAGDDALKYVADILKKSFRREDIYGRIGGDEFAIVLPNIGLNDAYKVAERARRRVNDSNDVKMRENNINLAVSIGLVEYNIGEEDLIKVMKRADENLYIAKKIRNTVEK
ncbi:GGDEF domain-containing protein [Brenneria rubrifaciens]|uniref:diguanylate cyclase n=1 Tax=Brenneria rubrifaciens TaxID=55213 RepID=A0A4V1FA29_9GAMM|nr:GGDEF domain-containing protein [Brenneria rubrifaciens]QCR09633.1 GGDEF domain-containing protein [Brenneria rubrifaciens]